MRLAGVSRPNRNTDTYDSGSGAERDSSTARASQTGHSVTSRCPTTARWLPRGVRVITCRWATPPSPPHPLHRAVPRAHVPPQRPQVISMPSSVGRPWSASTSPHIGQVATGEPGPASVCTMSLALRRRVGQTRGHGAIRPRSHRARPGAEAATSHTRLTTAALTPSSSREFLSPVPGSGPAHHYDRSHPTDPTSWALARPRAARHERERICQMTVVTPCTGR